MIRLHWSQIINMRIKHIIFLKSLFQQYNVLRTCLIGCFDYNIVLICPRNQFSKINENSLIIE